MRWAALALLGSLAACQQAAEQSAPTPTASPTVEPALPAPESLMGEYRVAGIDGKEFDAAFGIALSITEGQVTFEPACAFRWSYAYKAGKLDIERRQERRQHPPPPTCDEPVIPELQQLATALDAVDRAGRTPANGIELSGNGRSVLLFTQ